MSEPGISHDKALNTENLGSRTRTAIGWKLLSQIMATGLHMVASIILARLLMPKDFGILGMATMVTGLAGIFRDLGLGQALVQRKDLDRDHLASAYWGTLVMGGLLTGLTLLLAPYIGIFFKEPRMVPVLQVISFSFLISPFATIPNAMMQRDLDFRRPFYAGLANSVTYAAVGLTMAYLGYSYWSLVGALLSSTLAGTIATCIITRHLPPLVPCFRGIKDLYGFGVGATGTSVFNYLAQQADYFVVGRWLNSEALGLYTRAFTLVHQPLTQIASILYPVLFPAFAKVQHDTARVRDILSKTISAIASIAWPALAVLAVTAPELIPCVFGERWEGAVIPVQIMAFAGMLRTINNPFGAVAKAFGKVYDEMWRQIAYAALLFGGALIGQRWGIVGVSWAVLFSTVAFFVMVSHLSYKCCHFGVFHIGRALLEPVSLSLAVIALASCVRYWALHRGMPELSVLVLSILAALAVVIVAILCFPRSSLRSHLKELQRLCGRTQSATLSDTREEQA